MKREVYHINGMHCRSCEITIEDNLSRLKGVKQVKVNHRKGTAEILAEGALPVTEIQDAVAKAGYSLGTGEKPPLMSKNLVDYIEVFFAAGVLLLIYIILKLAGISDFNLAPGKTEGYGVVFLIGLTAGVSTCMALVGGLVLGVSAKFAARHPEATAAQKFRPHLFFNLGRLVSYAALGGLIGLLGSALKLSGSLLGVFIMFAGLTMFLLGVNLLGIFPRLDNILVLPKWIARLFGLNKESAEYSHRGAFISGFLTFFLPCGFTQAMQIYAISTGSFSKGAAIMFLFALGTMPGIIGVGGLTSVIKGTFARRFFKFAGVVVILFGILNISGGYNLGGFTFASGSSRPKDSGAVEVRIVDGVQIVNMQQNGNGYVPNYFVIKKGIPVKWIIDSTSAYTCASSLVVPALNMVKNLKVGENVVEFTPMEVGPLKFSCSMGMYAGYFEVVE